MNKPTLSQVEHAHDLLVPTHQALSCVQHKENKEITIPPPPPTPYFSFDLPCEWNI